MAEQEFKDNNAADRPEQLNAGAPPAGNSPAQPASATTPPKKKKSRLLLKIAGGAVVLIILLVLAAPTLLSTGPVVSIALGQVNNQLNGHVEVNSVSLGWFSGVKVDGVRVFDAGKSQIAQLDHLVVPLPLWKAAMGNLSLGDVVCDGLSCDAKFDDQHRLNFAQLVKPSTPSSATPPATPAPAGESKPSKLPNISGNIKLTNCQVTVSQPNQPTVFLGKINGEFKIPDINQPISDTLALTIRAGDGPEGSVNVSGTAAAIKANQVAVDSADIHQTVEVNDLDLQTAKPFIPASEGVDTLAGVLGIHVAVDLTGGKNAQVDAAITGKKQIAVGGKVLNGDTFSTDTFTVAVPKLTAVFPSGLNQWQTARVQVGSAAGSSPILFKLDQGQVTVVADLVPQGVLNLIAGTKPADDGKLVVDSSFDLARIFPQLKKTIPDSAGLLVTRGGFSEKLTLAMTAEKADFSESTDFSQILGTQTASGKSLPLNIPPIHLAVSTEDHGSGSGGMPDLRSIKLDMQSSFANGTFQGASLADLNGTLTANLGALRAQLTQFLPDLKLNLGGNLQVKIGEQGQLDQPPYDSSLKLDITGSNLLYSQPGEKSIQEPLVQLSLAADLHGSAQRTLDSVRKVQLTLKVGNAGAPTVDLAAEASNILLAQAKAGGKSGTTLSDTPALFKVDHLKADLSRLQEEFAAVPVGTAGTVVNQGALMFSTQGTVSAKSLSLSALTLSVDRLFLARQLSNGDQVNALQGESIAVNTAAAVDLATAADGKSAGITARIQNLTINDAGKIIDIHKSNTGDFVVSQTATGGLSGNGQLALAVELGSLNHIAKILGQNELTVKTGAGDVKSGTLTGTVTLVPAAASKTGVDAELKVDNLVVTTDTGALPAQSAAITVKATADQAANTIALGTANLESDLASASLTNAVVSLGAASTLDEIQSAHWQVEVPDLKPVMELADAFSPPPPAAAPPAANSARPDPSAPKPLPPLKITSGVIFLTGDISHDGPTMKINVSNVSAKNVAFIHGDQNYTAKPINLKLLIAIATGDGKTVMDQIQQVQVTQLTGDLGIAKLTMPTPIVVTQLATAPQANGSISLVGNLTDLIQFYTAYEGEKPDGYPYRGDYTLTENIASQPGNVGLKGGLNIARFQSFNGDSITFSEDLLAVANDLALLTKGDDQSVLINSLGINMQSSGALNLTIANGNIAHLQSTRDMLLQPNLTYDLAKLWPIVEPMMGDSYKTLKITGQFQKQFHLSGRYPVGLPSTEAIKTVHADGDLAVATFDYDGLSMQNFVVPFTLDGGQLVTVYYGKPAGQNTAPPAAANGGTLDLSNLTVDLTQDPIRLTSPANKQVISQMTINPLFAQSFLAKVFNNPVFAGAQEATGLLDLTIVDCNALPLGKLVTLPDPANTGVADLTMSLTKLNIGLQGVSGLGSALKTDSFTANVNGATVSVAKGISTQHISFATGQYSLNLDGSVRLADEAFDPMELSLGPLPAIFGHLGVRDPNVVKNLPDRVTVPVEGTVDHAKVNLVKAFGKAGADAAKKAIANRLIGGNGDGSGGKNPLGGLLKKLGQ